MKYLSFDIECCDGQHICEFGYVLIDEQFNVLERDCITINPEYKFKLCDALEKDFYIINTRSSITAKLFFEKRGY